MYPIYGFGFCTEKVDRKKMIKKKQYIHKNVLRHIFFLSNLQVGSSPGTAAPIRPTTTMTSRLWPCRLEHSWPSPLEHIGTLAEPRTWMRSRASAWTGSSAPWSSACGPGRPSCSQGCRGYERASGEARLCLWCRDRTGTRPVALEAGTRCFLPASSPRI